MQDVVNDEGLSTSLMIGAIADSKTEFFLAPSWQKLMIACQDFLKSHVSIGLLEGPLSSGKTTLLHTLKQQAVYYCHYLNAIDLANPVNATLSINSIVAALDAPTTKKVFIIDDADQLSISDLQLLVLAFQQSASTKIKLLLAGETIVKRVAIIAEKHDIAINPVLFQINSLSRKEIKLFLSQSLCNTLPHGSNLLSHRHINYIHTLSEGYIGRVIRIALQIASEQKVIELPKQKHRSSLLDKLLSVAILCLLAVVGMRLVLLLNKETNKAPIVTQVVMKPSINTHVTPIKPIEEPATSFIASISGAEEILLSQQDEALMLPAPAE